MRSPTDLQGLTRVVRGTVLFHSNWGWRFRHIWGMMKTAKLRSIGAAIAKRLATDGANVAITYTKGADAAASVVKEIERVGRKAIAIQADDRGRTA
jgi:hypothetical protein